jgi:hypothetical protein
MGTESFEARLREISKCNKTIQRQIVSVDEESWGGRHVCLQIGRHNGVAMLQKHAQGKSEDPRGTSALAQAAGAASEFVPLMEHVTPKDVSLEAFHGSEDPESLVIDKEFFLRLLSWLRASVILIILNPKKTSKQSGGR